LPESTIDDAFRRRGLRARGNRERRSRRPYSRKARAFEPGRNDKHRKQHQHDRDGVTGRESSRADHAVGQQHDRDSDRQNHDVPHVAAQYPEKRQQRGARDAAAKTRAPVQFARQQESQQEQQRKEARDRERVSE